MRYKMRWGDDAFVPERKQPFSTAHIVSIIAALTTPRRCAMSGMCAISGVLGILTSESGFVIISLFLRKRSAVSSVQFPAAFAPSLTLLSR